MLYYARWENPVNDRYYEVYIGRDFFGLCLTQVWGGKGTTRGQIRHHPCNDINEGRVRMTMIHRQREQKGYILQV